MKRIKEGTVLGFTGTVGNITMKIHIHSCAVVIFSLRTAGGCQWSAI
jgi:hypothetical protein